MNTRTERSSQTKAGVGPLQAKLIALSLAAPILFFFAQYLFAPDSFGLTYEWNVIEETGRRVRGLPPRQLRSKKAIVENWDKTEQEVRREQGEGSEEEEPQGMWIEW